MWSQILKGIQINHQTTILDQLEKNCFFKKNENYEIFKNRMYMSILWPKKRTKMAFFDSRSGTDTFTDPEPLRVGANFFSRDHSMCTGYLRVKFYDPTTNSGKVIANTNLCGPTPPTFFFASHEIQSQIDI